MIPMLQDTRAHPKANHGKPRIQHLSEEDKLKLEAMASPADMDSGERKRQYSAMRRAIAKSAEPALLAKFQLSNDGERPNIYLQTFFPFDTQPYSHPALGCICRWSMLKQWLSNDGNTDSISIEEKYSRWVEQLRTDRYVTVHGLQL